MAKAAAVLSGVGVLLQLVGLGKAWCAARRFGVSLNATVRLGLPEAARELARVEDIAQDVKRALEGWARLVPGLRLAAAGTAVLLAAAVVQAVEAWRGS